MLYILKRTFTLIIVLFVFNSCQVRPVSSAEKSAKVKAKIERKHKAEREKNKKIAIKKHFDNQAKSTQELMERNKAESDYWRKKNYNNKSISNRIKDFISDLKPEIKPRDGIYTKKQKKGRKSSFIVRVFKKKK